MFTLPPPSVLVLLCAAVCCHAYVPWHRQGKYISWFQSKTKLVLSIPVECEKKMWDAKVDKYDFKFSCKEVGRDEMFELELDLRASMDGVVCTSRVDTSVSCELTKPEKFMLDRLLWNETEEIELSKADKLSRNFKAKEENDDNVEFYIHTRDNPTLPVFGGENAFAEFEEWKEERFKLGYTNVIMDGTPDYCTQKTCGQFLPLVPILAKDRRDKDAFAHVLYRDFREGNEKYGLHPKCTPCDNFRIFSNGGKTERSFYPPFIKDQFFGAWETFLAPAAQRLYEHEDYLEYPPQYESFGTEIIGVFSEEDVKTNSTSFKTFIDVCYELKNYLGDMKWEIVHIPCAYIVGDRFAAVLGVSADDYNYHPPSILAWHGNRKSDKTVTLYGKRFVNIYDIKTHVQSDGSIDKQSLRQFIVHHRSGLLKPFQSSMENRWKSMERVGLYTPPKYQGFLYTHGADMNSIRHRKAQLTVMEAESARNDMDVEFTQLNYYKDAAGIAHRLGFFNYTIEAVKPKFYLFENIFPIMADVPRSNWLNMSIYPLDDELTVENIQKHIDRVKAGEVEDFYPSSPAYGEVDVYKAGDFPLLAGCEYADFVENSEEDVLLLAHSFSDYYSMKARPIMMKIAKVLRDVPNFKVANFYPGRSRNPKSVQNMGPETNPFRGDWHRETNMPDTFLLYTKHNRNGCTDDTLNPPPPLKYTGRHTQRDLLLYIKKHSNVISDNWDIIKQRLSEIKKEEDAQKIIDNKELAEREAYIASLPVLELEKEIGAISKVVLEEGDGEVANINDQLLVNYEIYVMVNETHKTEIFKNTHPNYDPMHRKEHFKPYKFTLGVGDVVRCWDIALTTMRKGEVAQITCNSKNAYGNISTRGFATKKSIPGGSTMRFVVTILDITRYEDIVLKTEKQKLEAEKEKAEKIKRDLAESKARREMEDSVPRKKKVKKGGKKAKKVSKTKTEL